MDVKNSTTVLKPIAEKEVEPIVKSIDEYEEGETFEDLVIKKFNPFIGLSTDEIIEKLKINKPTAKNILNILSKSIMGVMNKKIELYKEKRFPSIAIWDPAL